MEVATVSLAARVAAELLKVSRLIELGNRPLNKNGRRRIGPTQGRILTVLLSRFPDHITLSGLANDVALSHATASEAVRALATRGFVRKTRSRNDARMVYLSLSASGRRKSEEAATGSNQLRKAIGRLPRREQEMALHTMKNIQQAMDLLEKKPWRQGPN